MRKGGKCIKLKKMPVGFNKEGANWKKVWWPFWVWTCTIPTEAKMSRPDILEQLYLDTKSIEGTDVGKLFEVLGFDADLLDAVRKDAEENGFISPTGTKVGSGIWAKDLHNHYERTHLFKDAVSGNLVPDFSVSSLPRESLRDIDPDDMFLKECSSAATPSPMEIGQALKQYRELCRYKTERENLPEPISGMDSGKSQQVQRIIGSIELWEDQPEMIYLPVALNIDLYMIDAGVKVYSPFPVAGDDWAETLLAGGQRAAAFRANEQETSDLSTVMHVLENEIRVLYQDEYPFGNVLGIELFNQFPLIANQERFKDLRLQIEGLKRMELRILKGDDDDYDSLYTKCAKVIECMFDACIRLLPEHDRHQAASFIQPRDFRHQIADVAQAMQVALPDNYVGISASNVKQVSVPKNHMPKNSILFLLIYAHCVKEKRLVQLFRANDKILEDIDFITGTRNRKGAHFTGEADENPLETMREMLEATDKTLRLFCQYFMIGRKKDGEEKDCQCKKPQE